jgi:AcrR family transcriptional regulator
MTTRNAVTFGARFTEFRSPDARVPDDAPRRDRILDAARRCYVTIGWDKTTMDDVGRVAGMSRATLYKNFPGSEILHTAVRRVAVDMMRQDFEDALAAGEDLAESLGNAAAALTVWCSTVRSPNNPSSLYFRAHAEESAVIIDLLEDVLRPRLEAARQHGEINSTRDAGRTAQWVARCVTGFALLPPGREGEAEYPLIVREFVREFVVSAL